jgi:hypothetical protein
VWISGHSWIRFFLPDSLIGAICTVLFALTACGQHSQLWNDKAGVLFQHPDAGTVRSLAAAATLAKPPRNMTGSGLAGVMGGVQVKAVAPGEPSLLLPLPQLADCQAPVAYTITCAPENTLSECRIQVRIDRNAFLNLRLKVAAGQVVKIQWSAVVLIASKSVTTDQASVDEYTHATACAQSDDKQIAELATRLWPASGDTGQYARRIQDFIRDLKQTGPPRSLDAAGMLGSGANWICTANANLACALMRARHVPCRSIAVVPPISRKLEMHRVVEYYDRNLWVSFDPSVVQPDVPLKPWHEIAMAKTTAADEETSMKPRMGSAPGCPFGQEIELSAGLTLSGNEFYWTIAAPLAQFEVSDEAARRTADEWNKFLKTGIRAPNATKAAAATNLDQFLR